MTVVATCYLLGVSTRRIEKLVDSLSITSLSKSQVPVVARDALSMKVREGGRLVNIAVLVATGVTGINGDAHREILGLQVATTEDGAGWLACFRDLIARG